MEDDRELIEALWNQFSDDCDEALRRAMVHEGIKKHIGSPSEEFIDSVIDELIQKNPKTKHPRI
jgi:hypothetical protein